MYNDEPLPCKFIAHDYGSRGRWESLWIEERESSSQSIAAELLSILQFRILSILELLILDSCSIFSSYSSHKLIGRPLRIRNRNRSRKKQEIIHARWKQKQKYASWYWRGLYCCSCKAIVASKSPIYIFQALIWFGLYTISRALYASFGYGSFGLAPPR